MESGKDIFKKANLGKISNRKIIKYGKIGDNIGYELAKYINNEKYTLSFVEKIGEDYIYDYNKCIEGSLQDMIKYIVECEKEKNIIKFKKTIDKL